MRETFDTPSTTRMQPAGTPAWLGWALAGAFIGVAFWLSSRSPALNVPLGETASFDRVALVPQALRVAMIDPPHTVLEGKDRVCGECHIRGQAAASPRAPSPHAVTLGHGMNDWCFNCHDAGDRDRLVLQDTTTVAYSEVPVLCAQCHGTTYRDWQRGMHGKTMGSWDKSSGKQRRLLCTECHNPHAPAYGRLAPLPGPRTLRMNAGDEKDHQEGADPSPLHRRVPGAGGKPDHSSEDHTR